MGRNLVCGRPRDEARIGQKNGQVRQWARRGTRPRQPADQRFDNAYLFGAICPPAAAGDPGKRVYWTYRYVIGHKERETSLGAREAHTKRLEDRAPVADGPLAKMLMRVKRDMG